MFFSVTTYRINKRSFASEAAASGAQDGMLRLLIRWREPLQFLILKNLHDDVFLKCFRGFFTLFVNFDAYLRFRTPGRMKIVPGKTPTKSKNPNFSVIYWNTDLEICPKR